MPLSQATSHPSPKRPLKNTLQTDVRPFDQAHPTPRLWMHHVAVPSLPPHKSKVSYKRISRLDASSSKMEIPKKSTKPGIMYADVGAALKAALEANNRNTIRGYGKAAFSSSNSATDQKRKLSTVEGNKPVDVKTQSVSAVRGRKPRTSSANPKSLDTTLPIISYEITHIFDPTQLETPPPHASQLALLTSLRHLWPPDHAMLQRLKDELTLLPPSFFQEQGTFPKAIRKPGPIIPLSRDPELTDDWDSWSDRSDSTVEVRECTPVFQKPSMAKNVAGDYKNNSIPPKQKSQIPPRRATTPENLPRAKKLTTPLTYTSRNLALTASPTSWLEIQTYVNDSPLGFNPSTSHTRYDRLQQTISTPTRIDLTSTIHPMMTELDGGDAPRHPVDDTVSSPAAWMDSSPGRPNGTGQIGSSSAWDLDYEGLHDNDSQNAMITADPTSNLSYDGTIDPSLLSGRSNILDQRNETHTPPGSPSLTRSPQASQKHLSPRSPTLRHPASRKRKMDPNMVPIDSIAISSSSSSSSESDESFDPAFQPLPTTHPRSQPGKVKASATSPSGHDTPINQPLRTKRSEKALQHLFNLRQEEYDYCHQCRCRSNRSKMKCSSKPCGKLFCCRCIFFRYGDRSSLPSG